MKAIVYQRVVKKSYFLGYEYLSRWFLQDAELTVNSNVDDRGEVRSKNEFQNWEAIFVSKDFNRELTSKDKISIDNNIYSIETVAHESDGTIHYYTDKSVTIDDEESKIKANRDLDARKIFVANRDLEKIKAQVQEYKDAQDVKIALSKKKRFWARVLDK